MATILNTNRVYSNLVEQCWYKKRMMIARWSETLIKVSRTLLEEERSKFTVGVSERFEDKD